jgi:hypothetical protein
MGLPFDILPSQLYRPNLCNITMSGGAATVPGLYKLEDEGTVIPRSVTDIPAAHIPQHLDCLHSKYNVRVYLHV